MAISASLKSLLRGCQLDEFVKAVRDPEFRDRSLADIAREAAHQFAPVLYQEQYVAYVPHSLMTLAAALQAANFLPEPEKKLPLIQALWLAGSEEKIAAPLVSADAGGSGKGTVQDLSVALTENDFKKAQALAGCLLADPSTFASCRDLLVLTALRDIANMGHKFLYVAKTLELLETLPGADTASLIFPALHHLAVGASDTGYFSLLQTRFKDLEPEAAQFMKNEIPITEDEAKRLEHVLVYQYPGLIIENLAYELQQGVSADELFQVVLSAASQALTGAFKENWLYPVHGYNFAHEGWEYFRKVPDPLQKMNFLFMSALFVNKMAVKSMDPHKTVKFEEVDLAGQEESLAGLAKAVEESRPEIAGALAVKLLDKADFQELARILVRAASKNDSGVCAGHDLKLAVHALLDYPRMRAGLRAKLIPALAYFLAQVEKDYDLFNALTEKTAT